MFKLDNDFLISLGLGSLPVDEKNKLLQVIYERLEMNVGMRLAEKMTDQQLTEFEGFIDRNDEAGALRWLETNFPNYKQVVAEELEKLKNEVKTAAPQILAAAGNAAAPPVQSMQPSAAPAPAVPPAATPGQPAAPASPAYNPENPFQTHNPETSGISNQMPPQPAWQPAPQPPQPMAPPTPQYQPAPGFQPPVQQPPYGPAPSQAPQPPYSPPVPPTQPPAGPPSQQ